MIRTAPADDAEAGARRFILPLTVTRLSPALLRVNSIDHGRIMADHDKQHTMSVLAPATAVATSLVQPGPGLTFSNPFDRSLAYPDSQFSIPLASTAHATIVKRALSVDRERHPDEVKVVMEGFESGLSMSVSPSSPIPRPRRSRWLTPL